jgi:GNAT superfamily N-acetyltransferase
MIMSITIRQVDYSDLADAAALVDMLDAYARDPMGGGKPLSAHTRQHLAAELAKRPHAVSFLAFDDGVPAGVLNAFEGFSTFACKPLLNVHDIAVHADHRGKGIGRMLLDAVELKRAGAVAASSRSKSSPETPAPAMSTGPPAMQPMSSIRNGPGDVP